MNNYDRIYEELKRQSDRLAPEYDIDPEKLLALTMLIVDQEDKNAVKRIAINKIVEGEILKMVDQMPVPEWKGY